MPIKRRYTLSQLEYFAAVADRGSMTLAAQDLQVSQSAVSLAIGALERELGVALFHRRSAKGLTLTERGRRVLADARRVLAGAAEFDSRLVEHDAGVRGPVNVGCFAPLGPFFLPSAIRALRATHPTLDVHCTEGSMLAIQEALLEGRTEVAVSYDHEILPGIATEVVVDTTPMHVVMPRAHRLASRAELSVADLADEDLIVLRVPPTQRYLQRQLAAAGLAGRVRFTPSSYELACALAGQGLGCAVVGFPTASPVTVDGHEIVSARLALPAPTFAVVLAHVEGIEMSTRARLFADAVSAAAARARRRDRSDP